MSKKICDFCLEEKKGIFNRVRELPDGHFICKDCARKIESYDLPVKYGLFQLLVLAEPEYRPMIMRDYLQNHPVKDILIQYYPVGDMSLHEGERLVNKASAAITVSSASIPQEFAPDKITQITKKNILNLADDSMGKEVQGTLYETNAAVYFLSPYFINCHRLSTIDLESRDCSAIHIVDHGKHFTYALKHADLFRMRSSFYQRAIAAKNNKNNKLIYLESENTMTLTSGVYSVPSNIKSGTYYVNAVDTAKLNVRDPNGRVHLVKNGKINIAEGSTVEVTGEYQFRLRNHEEHKK